GDRLWALDHIDPRFARDPLFDAPEEIGRAPGGRKKRKARVVPAALAALGASISACSESPAAAHAPDAILVQLKSGATLPALAQDLTDGPPFQPLADLAADGEQPLLRLPVPAGVAPDEFARRTAADDAVEFAEPVYLYRPNKVANDPRYKDLWGLQQIEAPAAWDRTTGDR